MLVGILFIQAKTPDHSFALQSFYDLKLPVQYQSWLFWLFFAAFAVKLPLFPFHTWQPDTYEEVPTSVTMILSGVMVKMGLLGLLRWLLPVLPLASYMWGDVAMTLAVVGIVYASLLAIRQDDIKRLVAYSSIAHIGLMAMALFAENMTSLQGAILQMFNHGINIIGMWVMVDIIERRFGTRKISELGGIAIASPTLAIYFVVIALANIALPLTNGFVGEFLMFNGVMTTRSNYYLVFTLLAGLGIILSAVYTLNLIRKVFYGEATEVTKQSASLTLGNKFVLTTIVLLIIVLGVYPQLVLNYTEDFAKVMIRKIDISYLFR
jgi:NADH-quinone oxidoreductase subunit M